jgi:hypothetical protein
LPMTRFSDIAAIALNRFASLTGARSH